MGKVVNFFPSKQDHAEYNRGYSDGYRNHPTETSPTTMYLTGYDVGTEDRHEDDEAITTGQVDHLSDSERELLYGNEKDQI